MPSGFPQPSGNTLSAGTKKGKKIFFYHNHSGAYAVQTDEKAQAIRKSTLVQHIKDKIKFFSPLLTGNTEVFLCEIIQETV